MEEKGGKNKEDDEVMINFGNRFLFHNLFWLKLFDFDGGD